MSLGTNAWLLISGGGLILLGYLIRRWSSGYDLNDAVLGSAWQAARGRRTADNPTEIEQKLREIQAEASVVGKARRTAHTVAGHFVAQVMGLVALVMLLAGAVLIAAGIFWG